MLITKRPTQTTVSYTVSTRSPSDGLTGRLTSYGLILLRIAAGLFVATVLLSEFNKTSIHKVYLGSDHSLAWLESAVLDSPVGLLASMLIANSTWIWRAVICAGVTWLILRKGYTEESLLVIRGLGVQTSTSSPSYLWMSSTRFIPTSSIQDIFIHEAFQGFEVRFYLSIVVEGEEDVVVVFPVSMLGSIDIGSALTRNRAYYHDATYWNKSGEVRGRAYTSQSLELGMMLFLLVHVLIY